MKVPLVNAVQRCESKAKNRGEKPSYRRATLPKANERLHNFYSDEDG